MKNSVLHRSFVYIDPAGSEYEINTGRFISYHDRDIAQSDIQ